MSNNLCSAYFSSILFSRLPIMLSGNDISPLYLVFGDIPRESGANAISFNDTIDTNLQVWDALVGAKRIKPTDISFLIERNDWVANSVYETWDIESNTTSNTYVLTEDNRVYLCLDKLNGSNTSTNTYPTTTSTTPEITPDGYVWKYLYTVNDSSQVFYTNEYIPLPTTNSKGITGKIEHLKIESPGSYTVGGEKDLIIEGTGANFEGTATLTEFSNGFFGVTSVSVDAVGDGYLFVNSISVNVESSYTNVEATITPVIAPSGGFENLLEIFKPNTIIIKPSLIGTESQNATPVLYISGDTSEFSKYRMVGIMSGLTLKDGSSANGNAYCLLSKIIFNDEPNTPELLTPGTKLYQNKSAGTEMIVVSYDVDSKTLFVRPNNKWNRLWNLNNDEQIYTDSGDVEIVNLETGYFIENPIIIFGSGNFLMCRTLNTGIARYENQKETHSFIIKDTIG